jgi:hypothetical protein
LAEVQSICRKQLQNQIAEINHKSSGVGAMLVGTMLVRTMLVGTMLAGKVREERGLTSAVCTLRSAIAVVLLVTLVACAAPSPPLPPSLDLPAPATDLHAVRKGNKVVLTWSVPQQTTDGEGIRFLGPTRICRALLSGPEATRDRTKEKLADCGKPAAELSSLQLDTTKEKPSSNGPQRVSARYKDSLPVDWMRDPAASVLYAVESLNTSHRSAALSNQVRVSAAPAKPPPTDFAVQLTARGVLLTWTGPLLSIPGGDGTPHYFYRVFRSTEGAPQSTLVGEIEQGVQAQMRLLDNAFVWEKTYEYRVNVTTRIATGAPHACSGESTPLPACKDSIEVEGEDSAPVTIVAHDIFPPAVPAALQAVFSGVGQKPFIDLTWNANTDADLTGYNVYRRDGMGEPARINTDLVKAPAYRDATVASGQTYFYSVAAVDARGNESVRSEEASERVP